MSWWKWVLGYLALLAFVLWFLQRAGRTLMSEQPVDRGQ
jgi:hypothetical protein